jgi:hypothetical protein
MKFNLFSIPEELFFLDNKQREVITQWYDEGIKFWKSLEGIPLSGNGDIYYIATKVIVDNYEFKFELIAPNHIIIHKFKIHSKFVRKFLKGRNHIRTYILWYPDSLKYIDDLKNNA